MILNFLKKRCSVRRFSSKPISENIIAHILEAGRLSPSGGNEQPWKFGVITAKEQIELISKASYNQKWISTSPLLIVLCSVIVSDDKGGREIQTKRFPRWKNEIENMDKELYSCLNLEEHQTKIPGTHMILQALEHGMYSTWISYFNAEEVSEILGLPRFYIPSEIIAFGYPAGNVNPMEKKKTEEITFYNKYNG